MSALCYGTLPPCTRPFLRPPPRPPRPPPRPRPPRGLWGLAVTVRCFPFKLEHAIKRERVPWSAQEEERRRKEKKGEERRRKKKKEEERRRKKKKGEERRKRLRLVLCLKSCQGSIGGGAHLSERRHHAGCTLLIRPATPVRNLADEHTVDLRLGGGLAHSRAAGLGDVQQVCMHHAKQRARKKRSKGRKQTDAKKRSRENGSE